MPETPGTPQRGSRGEKDPGSGETTQVDGAGEGGLSERRKRLRLWDSAVRGLSRERDPRNSGGGYLGSNRLMRTIVILDPWQESPAAFPPGGAVSRRRFGAITSVTCPYTPLYLPCHHELQVSAFLPR